jgi:hypothetical protein
MIGTETQRDCTHDQYPYSHEYDSQPRVFYVLSMVVLDEL